MFAVSASRTMKNARPKFREDDVVVRDIVQIREERRLEAIRRAEEARLARIEAASQALEMYRLAEEQKRREAIAAAQQKRAEYLMDVAVSGARYTHTFREVERRAMRLFRLTKRELYSKRRNKEVVFARQFIMYWACRLTKRSLPEIGRLMGGLDHTTCLSGKRAYPKKRAEMGRHLREAR